MEFNNQMSFDPRLLAIFAGTFFQKCPSNKLKKVLFEANKRFRTGK